MSEEANHNIEIVEKQDSNRKNSPIIKSEDSSAEPRANCFWNGNEYSPGASVCFEDRKYVCVATGYWQEVGPC